MAEFAQKLDWNLLYKFMIVVQQKSMTKAAEQLFRSQPAISLALKKLEETVGTPLLERGPNKLVVTPAGEALYDEACKIYAAISRLPVSFNVAPQSISGMIKIATIDHVVSQELDSTITRFFSEYPKTEISMTVSTTAEIVQMIELGHCTMGVCDGVIPKSLVKRYLLQEEFGLYCGRSDPLFGMENLALRDLRGKPFIGFTADVLGGQHMGDVTALRAKASIGQTVRGQSSNVHEVRRMIECGLGIGFLPTHLSQPYEQAGTLWRLPPYDELPSASVFLIYNPATNFSDAERLFINSFSW